MMGECVWKETCGKGRKESYISLRTPKRKSDSFWSGLWGRLTQGRCVLLTTLLGAVVEISREVITGIVVYGNAA